MSFHIDREEFDEAVRECSWDWIWSAYEYAVNGGETTCIEKLKQEIKGLKDFAGRETERAESNGKRASEFEVSLMRVKEQLETVRDNHARAIGREADLRNKLNELTSPFAEAKRFREDFEWDIEQDAPFPVMKEDPDGEWIRFVEAVCHKCRERERIMASLPQDGSRGQKDAWDQQLDRISELEGQLAVAKEQLVEQENMLKRRYEADADHCNESLELQSEVEKLKRQRQHFINRGAKLEKELTKRDYSLRLVRGELALKVGDAPVLKIPTNVPFEEFVQKQIDDFSRESFEAPPGWSDPWAREYADVLRRFLETLKEGDEPQRKEGQEASGETL